jgi:hypothetical protein
VKFGWLQRHHDKKRCHDRGEPNQDPSEHVVTSPSLGGGTSDRFASIL